MSHCFRLLYSGKHILTYKEPIVRFEGKQREFLMDIRKNKFTYEYLMELVEKEMKELDELKEKSTLPWGCDIKKVNELYLNLIMEEKDDYNEPLFGEHINKTWNVLKRLLCKNRK